MLSQNNLEHEHRDLTKGRQEKKNNFSNKSNKYLVRLARECGLCVKYNLQ